MVKKYVEPNFSRESFTCPHCGTLSLMSYYTLCYRNGGIFQGQPGVVSVGSVGCTLLHARTVGIKSYGLMINTSIQT